MVKVIIGRRGSGKTKMLVDMANAATKISDGNVICIEKGNNLTFSIDSQARLIDVEEYGICGYDELYAFIAGIMARDYDVKEIFLDGIKKIGGDDVEKLASFLDRINDLIVNNEVNLIVTVSYDEKEVPDSIKKFIINN